MRTSDEIFNELVTEKNKYSSLSNLTNSRSTSIWRSLFKVIANSISISEGINEAYWSDIQSRANSLPVATTAWYAQKIKEFQYGDTLVWDTVNGKFTYETIDTTKQIVAGCSVSVVGSELQLKTCKLSNGSLTALTSAEQTALNTYIDKIKVAGTKFQSHITNAGDKLTLQMKVEVDGNLFSTTGQSLSGSNYPVEDAINSFLLTQGQTNFDNVFRIADLESAVMEVEGVRNCVITYAEVQPDASGYSATNILTQTLKSYSSYAGYLVIDSASPLRANITYYVI